MQRTLLKLRAAREMAGISLTDMAKIVGVTPSHLRRVELSERPVSRRLREIAVRTFGLPEEVLFSPITL